MEALTYTDSPLAQYLEGKLVVHYFPCLCRCRCESQSYRTYTEREREAKIPVSLCVKSRASTMLLLLSFHIKAVVLLSRMLRVNLRAETNHQKDSWITSPLGEAPAKSSPAPSQKNSFAPSNQLKFSQKLPQPLRLSIPTSGPVAKIHEVCSVCHSVPI
jgi:hypothetical protein